MSILFFPEFDFSKMHLETEEGVLISKDLRF